MRKGASGRPTPIDLEDLVDLIADDVHRGMVRIREQLMQRVVALGSGAIVWTDDDELELKGGDMEYRDFGWALVQLRSGRKVERAGWNGRGMYVVLQKGYPNGIPVNKNTAEATGLPEGTIACFEPYLMLRTVTGSFVPWMVSQTDALAEDYAVVP